MIPASFVTADMMKWETLKQSLRREYVKGVTHEFLQPLVLTVGFMLIMLRVPAVYNPT